LRLDVEDNQLFSFGTQFSIYRENRNTGVLISP